ncbi:hypothetical protein [Anaerotalea alkaliphila]|uniref:Uncharacterized protein n=1 Tax=Anaerotalea alkaliphila TaxID=2662126 RepID=A0A7X5KLR6_9FIRM|nr:hypothetical protein [Anaerotalea alkaliphila]NDL66979.1 hypothetical protein [Anaerotalea alkaliphila]
MRYLIFSLLFAIVHTVAYMAAGMATLAISKGIYEGRGRVMDYLFVTMK